MAGERIMVVENEKIVAMDLARCLQGLGYQVAAAVSCGGEAVDEARASRPDLVLMDVALPGAIDGIQAAHRIRASLDIPVVYLTAHSDPQTLQRAKITDPFGYILKPFEERDLRAAIEMALHRHKLEKALRESEEQHRRRSAELQALYEISLRLNAHLDINGLLKLIVELAVELLQADAGCFYLYNQQRGELTLAVATSYFDEFLGQTLKPGEGLAGQVFVNRAAMIVSDYSTWDGRAAVYTGETRFKATLAVPLLGMARVLGVLDIGGGGKKQAFDEHDQWLAELFAAQAAVALENAHLHAEETRRALELAALNQAGQAITSILDREEMLRVVMSQIKRLLNAEGASVLLHDPDSNELVFAAAAGPAADGLIGQRMPETAGVAGWTFQKRRAVLVNQAQQDARFYPHIDSGTGLTTQSVAAAPLMLRDRPLGVVEAINKATGDFDDHDVEILEVMAASIVVGIENARLFASLNREKDRLELLYYLSRQLAESLDVREVAQRAIDGVGAVVGASHGFVAVTDRDQALRVVAAAGYGPQTEQIVAGLPPVQLGLGLVGWVAAHRQPARIDNVARDERWFHISGLDDATRSALCMPLLSGDELVGVLCVYSEQPAFFDANALRLVESVAATVAVAITNARLFQQEQEQRRRLQESQAKLVHAEKMGALGQLVTAIAHEINNPLQAIQNNLDLALEDLGAMAHSSHLDGYLDTAMREIERVGQLVRRLRDFYRPARQEMRPTDVHVVLQDVLNLVSQQMRASGIAVECAWAADLPLVPANSDYLRQAFLNLVLNAVDAISALPIAASAPEGEIVGRLRVSTALSAPPSPQGDGAFVRIEFADTGAGIAPQDLPRVFDPFFTTKPHGAGLGLSISYGIIQAHRGEIAVDSRPGQGTTFSILLPVN